MQIKVIHILKLLQCMLNSTFFLSYLLFLFLFNTASTGLSDVGRGNQLWVEQCSFCNSSSGGVNWTDQFMLQQTVCSAFRSWVLTCHLVIAAVWNLPRCTVNSSDEVSSACHCTVVLWDPKYTSVSTIDISVEYYLSANIPDLWLTSIFYRSCSIPEPI